MALLSEPTIEAACKAAAIGHTTGHRWLQDPLVKERYAEARKEIRQRAMARLDWAANAAVDRLCEILRSGENEGAAVSAARAVLEFSQKAIEMEDIQQRLDAIEQAMKSQTFTPRPRVSVSYQKENSND
jgi:hypothetical protein